MNDLWPNVAIAVEENSAEEQSLADILYAREAEQAALGCVLLNPETLWALPKPSDFYDERHQRIAEAYNNLSVADTVIDMVTVADELRRMGVSEQVGGLAYLSHLMNSAPDDRLVEYYSNIVKRRGLLKKWWHLNIEATKRFWQPGQQPDAFFVWLRDELDGLLTGAQPIKDKGRTMQQAQYDFLGRYEERKRLYEQGVPIGWGVPFHPIAKHVEYLEPNSLMIIYGEGGVGKTSMGYQWHEEYLRQGYIGAFYQLEMSDEAVDNARTVRLTGVPLSVVRTGSGTSEQEDRLTQIAAEVAEWPGQGYLVNAAGMSIDDIVVDIERRHKVDGLQYFWLDHMKMLLDSPSDRQRKAKMNETQLFADNIRKLKGVCNRLGLRGFVLHHPSKEGRLYSSTDLQNLVDVIIKLEAQTATMNECYPGSGKIIARHGDLSWWVKFIIEKQKMGAMVTDYLFFERPWFRMRPDVFKAREDLEDDN